MEVAAALLGVPEGVASVAAAAGPLEDAAAAEAVDARGGNAARAPPPPRPPSSGSPHAARRDCEAVRKGAGVSLCDDAEAFPFGRGSESLWGRCAEANAVAAAETSAAAAEAAAHIAKSSGDLISDDATLGECCAAGE